MIVRQFESGKAVLEQLVKELGLVGDVSYRECVDNVITDTMRYESPDVVELEIDVCQGMAGDVWISVMFANPMNHFKYTQFNTFTDPDFDELQSTLDSKFGAKRAPDIYYKIFQLLGHYPFALNMGQGEYTEPWVGMLWENFAPLQAFCQYHNLLIKEYVFQGHYVDFVIPLQGTFYMVIGLDHKGYVKPSFVTNGITLTGKGIRYYADLCEFYEKSFEKIVLTSHKT